MAMLGQPRLAGCLFHFAEFAYKKGCTEICLIGAERVHTSKTRLRLVMTEQQPKMITIAWHDHHCLADVISDGCLTVPLLADNQNRECAKCECRRMRRRKPFISVRPTWYADPRNPLAKLSPYHKAGSVVREAESPAS
jgi:hypothetical protein